MREKPSSKSCATPPDSQIRCRAQAAGNPSSLAFAPVSATRIPALAVASVSVTRMNDAFTTPNASLAHASPSFAPASDSIALVSHLPSLESLSPVARASASFKSVNDQWKLIAQMPSPASVARRHQSDPAAKPMKTKQQPKVLARGLPCHLSPALSFRLPALTNANPVWSSRSTYSLFPIACCLAFNTQPPARNGAGDPDRRSARPSPDRPRCIPHRSSAQAPSGCSPSPSALRSSPARSPAP